MFDKQVTLGTTHYRDLAESSLHVKSLANDEIERDLNRSLLKHHHSMQAIN